MLLLAVVVVSTDLIPDKLGQRGPLWSFMPASCAKYECTFMYESDPCLNSPSVHQALVQHPHQSLMP